MSYADIVVPDRRQPYGRVERIGASFLRISDQVLLGNWVGERERSDSQIRHAIFWVRTIVQREGAMV